MCDGEHRDGVSPDFLKDGIGKMTKNVPPDRILVFRPHQRICRKPIHSFNKLGPERVGCNGTAGEVPQECFSDLRLCLRQDPDLKRGHRALSLALASAQETGSTVPARSAAWRALVCAARSCGSTPWPLSGPASGPRRLRPP